MAAPQLIPACVELDSSYSGQARAALEHLPMLMRQHLRALVSDDWVLEERIAKRQTISSAVRLQYGALPYCFNKAGELEVLLVTSRNRGRWIIPKGWPIKGLTPAKSAAREAFEEAGVQGHLGKKPLGRFAYEKLQDEDGYRVACEVVVFVLEVKRQLKSWPEIKQRERRWISAGDAAAQTDEEGLKPILEAFSVKMAARQNRDVR